MKAAILEAVNQPLTVEDIEPCNLSYGQVLVRVLCSGICGAQLQEIRGEKGEHFPRLMGHEGCGIVVNVGIGVPGSLVARKVVLHWRKGDGIESEPPRYERHNVEITGGRVTTFSEFTICSQNRITMVPDDTPNEFAAMLGCGLSTAIGTIEREAKVRFGESVLIVGCGGLGLNLILAARMAQAARVVAVDAVPTKRRLAIQMGAHEFRDAYSAESEKFDVAIDTSGNRHAISSALGCLAPSGRLIMVGQPPPGQIVEIFGARHLFEGEGKTIKATQGGGFNPTHDIPRYIAMQKAGLLSVEGIVSHRIQLSEINRGIDLVRNGQAGRVIIEM